MNNPRLIPLGPTASLCYYSEFLSADESNALLKQWTKDIEWEQSEIKIFGKTHAIPRLNAWYGDEPYAYSGTRFDAKQFTTQLEDLKARVESKCALQFNSVLLNWYRNGQDSMGWHSDDESSLGANPQIASVSLGETRRFVLREKANQSNKVELSLESGSLLLMLGETQSLWQHALPKTKKVKGSRVNLTFRRII